MTEMNKNSSNDLWVTGAVDPDLINITSQRVPFFQAFSTVTLGVKIAYDYTAMGASQVVLVVKNPQANAGDLRDAGSIPELGRSPGGAMATHSCILAVISFQELWKNNSTSDILNEYCMI